MALSTYYTPTKVVFGKNAVDETGKLLKEFGATKVLVHYGSKHAKKSGLIDKIEAQIKAEGIAYIELGGVVPNPRLSLAKEGIELCKKEKVDYLLAVGGGSVIDSAKCIGYGLFNGGNPWDFYDKKRQPKGCFPVGAVLTIAAAGSEMSDSSVITNEDGWLKRGYCSDYCRCRFAIEDPLLTMTLPDYQSESGCTDIMMHTMERYFSGAYALPLTDAISLALVRNVKDQALILKKDPSNYDARASVMLASSLSHNGLTNAGNDNKGDWACHQLEHELGGMFDCAHGAGLAAVWSSWARYVEKTDPNRFVTFGEGVFSIHGSAEQVIGEMEKFYRSIGMPTNLKELGIQPTDAQIEELATKCTFFGEREIGTFKKLNHSDIVKIYKMARG